MAPADIPKTSITTPFGLFEFLRMPFGLQTFQRFMNKVLQGLDFVFTYIDDQLIASSSVEEYLEHLRLVFQRLDEHGIVINVPKSLFGVRELDFLGHHVDTTGIRPLEEKVQVIREFLLPNTQRKLRRFLGLVNYLAASALPPQAHESPSDPPPWTDDTTTVFSEIKHALANTTLFVHPIPNAPTSVMMDASDTVVGAVLQQHINGQRCPLSFFSRALTPAETCYST